LLESFEGVYDNRDPGIEKVAAACRIAASLEYSWLWVDTVCIDKTNNVELSEAINSMFKWYRDSAICFVYLFDVIAGSSRQHFTQSEWFKRGWTLQELIAPKAMTFFDADWFGIGTKAGLVNGLSSITGVPTDLLENPSHLNLFSVAQRMSWAADRVTTRPEDIAYCLLGLLDINMEPLYGEGGERSFRRLQMRILSDREDESIFLWKPRDLPKPREWSCVLPISESSGSLRLECQVTGMLATRPGHFREEGSESSVWNDSAAGEDDMLEIAAEVTDSLADSSAWDDLTSLQMQSPTMPKVYIPENPVKLTSRGLDLTRHVGQGIGHPTLR